jgi:hypothetical protein
MICAVAGADIALLGLVEGQFSLRIPVSASHLDWKVFPIPLFGKSTRDAA